MIIFDTDDWLFEAEVGVDTLNGLRSKVELVGEVMPWVETEGEKAATRDCPPPPLLPPPPPWDALAEAAAEDAKVEVEKGVVARDRGDDSSWLEGSCCEPVWRDVRRDGEVRAAEELVLLPTSRDDEFRTEEKEFGKGDAEAAVIEGPDEDEPGRGPGSEGGKPVERGTRPRRVLD